MINIKDFISEYVIKRKQSMFTEDILNNRELLQKMIERKIDLVIGGAGAIGSSYIRVLLPYKPKSLVVVDVNENLTELTRDLRSSNEMYVIEDYITYPMDYALKFFYKKLKTISKL